MADEPLHIEIDPDENDGASWRCRNCKTTCASDNPCDCCMDFDMGY